MTHWQILYTKFTPAAHWQILFQFSPLCYKLTIPIYVFSYFWTIRKHMSLFFCTLTDPVSVFSTMLQTDNSYICIFLLLHNKKSYVIILLYTKHKEYLCQYSDTSFIIISLQLLTEKDVSLLTCWKLPFHLFLLFDNDVFVFFLLLKTDRIYICVSRLLNIVS